MRYDVLFELNRVNGFGKIMISCFRNLNRVELSLSPTYVYPLPFFDGEEPNPL